MGHILLHNAIGHMSGMAPLLVKCDIIVFGDLRLTIISSDGYPADTVEEMIQHACAEVREQRVHLYTRWHFAWAVKADPLITQ